MTDIEAPSLVIVQSEAQWWLAQGLQPIPLRLPKEIKPDGSTADGKEVRIKDWTKKKYGKKGTKLLFHEEANLGVVLSNQFVAVDFDNPIASILAPYFLPSTWTFQRKTNDGMLLVRNLYKLTEGEVEGTIKLKVPEITKAVIEILGSKRQTVAPPSIHKSGVPLEWGNAPDDMEITALPLSELTKQLKQLAGAVLLWDMWSEIKGHRNDVIGALAGAVLHAGWQSDYVLNMFNFIFSNMPHDIEDSPRERLEYVVNTIAKFEADEKISGLPSLSNLDVIPDKTLSKLADWWGLGKQDVTDILDLSEVEEAEEKPKKRQYTIADVEPWHEPVIGYEVLDELDSIIKRHVSMSATDRHVIVLWSPHTFIFDAFAHTPRILIDAPEKGCGKTLILAHILGNTVNKPQMAELLKPAPFFRLAESFKPTFLIDEADVFMNEDIELTAAINNGWESHGCVLRCVGDDHGIAEFRTHSPVAMSGIKLQEKVPESLLDRCLIINMERAVEGEIAEADMYDKYIHADALKTVARKLARWTQDNREAIQNCKPAMPKAARNREADRWRPLFKIAEVAGGNWAQYVKESFEACQPLTKITKAQVLITDVKKVMLEYGKNHITRNDLIIQLASLDASTWSNYNYSQAMPDEKVISAQQLSRLLKGYIKTKTVRINGKPVKGYNYEEIGVMCDRYALTEEQMED